MNLVRSRTFWWLFLTYGGIAIAATGGVGLVVDKQLELHEYKLTQDNLEFVLTMLEDQFARISTNDVETIQTALTTHYAKSSIRVTLIGDQGHVLADSAENPQRMENHSDRQEIAEAQQNGSATVVHFSRTTGAPMMFSARHVEHPGSLVSFIRVARPLSRMQEELTQLRVSVLIITLFIIGVAFILAFWLARRIADPLQQLTTGAKRIAQGEHEVRVHLRATGEVGVLAKTFNYMSERLAAQFAEVEQERQQLHAVLSGMVEGVVAIDRQGRVLFANNRASQLLASPLTTHIGSKLTDLIRHPTVLAVTERALARPDASRSDMNSEEVYGRCLSIYTAPLASSIRGGAVIVLHDVTDLRRLERVRQEFVANVSHELKTPLSVIKACSETLLDGAIDDLSVRTVFLQQIDDQSERLHQLILDLLSLARLESVDEHFQMQPVAIASVVRDCIECHRARAESKGQLLEGFPRDVTDSESDCQVWGDEEAISRIFENLIDNAIKYTALNGHISVLWYVEESKVCVEVTDNGGGIPETDISRIFERFYRVDKARSRELGGTGLGLSIVKHLIQAMRGTITVTSRIGIGTSFCVRLPLCASRTQQLCAATSPER